MVMIEYDMKTSSLILNLNSGQIKKSNPDPELSIYLSKLLTKSAQRFGQLSCKVNEVSSNGGWCSKISGKNSSHHVTDTGLAKALSDYLVGKRVASFGDGPGKYKEYISSLKKVKSYDAFDGAPFAELTTDNQVQFLDLSVPIYHLKPYDWILSIEVAEHIPKEFESIYVDNLARHALEGIIMSWAIPGQGGLSHVNEQSFDYVKSLFKLKGFEHLEKDSIMIRESSELSWIRSNLNVFKKI